MREVRSIICGGLLWFALAGCSTFNRDWDNYPGAGDVRASSDQLSAGQAALAGRWQGTWKSDVSGHTDELRCIISAAESGALAARYYASYAWCFTFEYTVKMNVTQKGEAWELSGKDDLGWFAGGVYHYQGEIIADAFKCRYHSDDDRGVFELTRFDGEDRE